MSKPIINLSYSTDTHEFNLLITNAEEVQYVLIYSAENKNVVLDEDGNPVEGEVNEETGDGKVVELSDLPLGENYLPPGGIPSIIEHALTSAGTGNDQFIFTETQLAGSASSGHEVYHDVKGGTLKLVIITPEGKQYQISQKFIITESGEVKIIGTETISKVLNGEFNKVLGDSTASAKVKKVTKETAAANETYTMERDQSSTVATSDAWKLPAGIAGAILLLFVIIGVVMIVKKKRGGGKEEVSSYTHSELAKLGNASDIKTTNDVEKIAGTASNAGIPEVKSDSKPSPKTNPKNESKPFVAGGSSTLQDKLNGKHVDGNSFIPKA